MKRPSWLSAAALGGRFATIRGGLVLVVLAALLPVTLLSLVQGRIALNDARERNQARLMATAAAIAEAEREPLIIARHSLIIARHEEAVRAIGPDCNVQLAVLLRGATGIVNFARTDRLGRVQCSVLPFIPGQDFSGDRWWRIARSTDELSLGPPELGKISQKLVLVMAVPVKTPDGEFDGTISAGVNLERLQASLIRNRVGGAGISAVVDREGTVIVSNVAGPLGPFPSVGAAAHAPAVAGLGEAGRWAYASAPLFRDQLFMVYAEPERSIMGAAESQWRLSLALPMLALILTSLAIWFGTHWLVVRWLNRLQRLTARFASGDLHIRDKSFEDAPEEFAKLSRDLHGMAAALRAHEADLTSALAAKTALTREIHHRVKNNLQIVTSLLTLQADRVPDPWARETLGQAKARIGALGLIHRLLYQQDRDNEQGLVNARLLLTELCAQLRAMHRDRADIDLECEAPDVTITVDQAVPMTLFCVEAVSNAFRHAFPGRAGSISLTYATEGETSRIEIADTGRGFRNEPGTARMGIDLMEAFASQLEGQLTLDSSGEGTTVTIVFRRDDR
jgi:two-component sensor histidine kinase